jgi:hypothetical protein
MLGVALLCFALVHIAPGDPLVSVLPADASAELQAQMRELYGFDRPLPEQFPLGLARAAGRPGPVHRHQPPVASEVMTAVVNTLRLAVVATLIGFVLGSLFGFVAGYFRNSWVDRACSMLSVLGVSVPHYWLGMVMVIIFSSQLMWLPATGAGPGGSGDWAWDWEHVQFMILPAITMSVIPMGIIARTVRALVAELLDQEFILGLQGQGPVARRRVPPCAEERRPHRAGRDGPAAGLSAGRLHPDRDRVLLARHRLPAEPGHLPARPAAAAGQHPGAGRVLRAAEPAGRRGADPARPPHRPLTATSRSPFHDQPFSSQRRSGPGQPLPAQRSRGYWASVLQRLLRNPVAMGAAAVILLLVIVAIFAVDRRPIPMPPRCSSASSPSAPPACRWAAMSWAATCSRA